MLIWLKKVEYYENKKFITTYKMDKEIINLMILKKVRPLCTILPKMRAYRRHFKETKYMSFLIKDDEFLGKYNKIRRKISNSLKRGFDREPVHIEKYLKDKIKSYEGKINTNF